MEFKDLTIDEANLIVQALAELPFKVSAALIQKLQAQGKAQIDAQPIHEGLGSYKVPQNGPHDGVSC